MRSDLLVLLFVYSLLPTLFSCFSLKKVFASRANDFIVWQGNFLVRLLITISFLPLLNRPDINLGLQFVGAWTNLLFWSALSVSMAMWILSQYWIVHSPLLFWGIEAGFTEEILFRGVVFGLANAIFENATLSVVISSIVFGIWHLKNFAWQARRKTITQIACTIFIYGPIFALERIMTGDIYLSIFTHVALNIFVTARGIFVVTQPLTFHGIQRNTLFEVKGLKTQIRNN